MKKEEKKKKKKRKLKFHIKIILLLIIIIIYAFTLGTKGIFTRDYTITTKVLSNKFDGFKIVHFSDLQYGSSANKKMVNKLVKSINESNADVVIFTGDLLSTNKAMDDDEETFLKKAFSKIHSNYGKYYVLGDQDDDIASTILNVSGFVNLSNNAQEVYVDNSNPILFINDKVDNYLKNYETKAYKVLVVHDPDEFTDYKKYNFNMVLAGHTLNGSINLYGLKNVFIDSKYTKSYQKINNTKMFISPGIGTKRIKARLFNHPTINLYRFSIN